MFPIWHNSVSFLHQLKISFVQKMMLLLQAVVYVVKHLLVLVLIHKAGWFDNSGFDNILDPHNRQDHLHMIEEQKIISIGDFLKILYFILTYLYRCLYYHYNFVPKQLNNQHHPIHQHNDIPINRHR